MNRHLAADSGLLANYHRLEHCRLKAISSSRWCGHGVRRTQGILVNSQIPSHILQFLVLQRVFLEDRIELT